MAAVAAPSEAEALKQMSILTPRLAQLEDIVLVLNPLYIHLVPQVEELLVRMQYRFVKRAAVTLDEEKATVLLEDKYSTNADGEEAQMNAELIEIFTNR